MTHTAQMCSEYQLKNIRTCIGHRFIYLFLFPVKCCFRFANLNCPTVDTSAPRIMARRFRPTTPYMPRWGLRMVCGTHRKMPTPTVKNTSNLISFSLALWARSPVAAFLRLTPTRSHGSEAPSPQPLHRKRRQRQLRVWRHVTPCKRPPMRERPALLLDSKTLGSRSSPVPSWAGHPAPVSPHAARGPSARRPLWAFPLPGCRWPGAMRCQRPPVEGPHRPRVSAGSRRPRSQRAASGTASRAAAALRPAAWHRSRGTEAQAANADVYTYGIRALPPPRLFAISGSAHAETRNLPFPQASGGALAIWVAGISDPGAW
jgi:hypothetical protein